MSDEQPEPLTHVRKMSEAMQGLVKHLRQDISKVQDPAFKAMFETAAEVLGGLVKAFQDYERKEEKAWK
jgi:hypothetical protein